jgi:hypothetical protein
MPPTTPEESIFSEELQALLALNQHPMAKQFRDLVVVALTKQSETDGRRKAISFATEHMIEIAAEIDSLLDIIKGLAEVIVKQTSFKDDQEPTGKEYLS